MRLRALPLAILLMWLCLASTAGAAQPPFSEVSRPQGTPRGYVITIHPGGWRLVGPGMAGLMHAEDARLNRWGYETLNVDHRKGAASLVDVTRFYDSLRARVGDSPICLDGWSSGGHLALMVAARRPDVACVISVAGPTYLPSLPQPLLGIAHRFFDRHGGLRAWSPATLEIGAPVLLAAARHDAVVPFEQSRRMSSAQVIALGRGSAAYVHGTVSRADLRRFHARERRFLRATQHH
jgi:pimeloyl-ACP methyl ester carboxylesterase